MKGIITNIDIFSTDSGGRDQALPLREFRCSICFDSVPDLVSKRFDCRIYMSPTKHVLPGESVDNILIRFLSPDAVMPFVYTGARFHLWEAKPIAAGYVIDFEQ